jgi:ABC-type polysaccharide/polyol phosphate transport system ATPase subunit
MSANQAIQAPSAPPALRPASSPVTIEVSSVEKTFRIPTHRIDSFKERVLHPVAGTEYRELRALRDVSFDIHRGEFFGIVGRNGSGKSTLLKILASIYRADAGRIRIAGRVAPFIELGVGLNHELTARENVVLNGVMMGLSRREARRSLDAVLDFAELEDFVDLKLKNYSSGMLVRLAFSVMVQSDAEVLLIDEVLAVGDAGFQRKCADTFREMHSTDRTIVLVTHDMTAIESYCDRAMLLHDGEQRYIGGPQEVARRYYRLNIENREPWGRERRAVPDNHARVLDAWLEDADGSRVTTVAAGDRLRYQVMIEARDGLINPQFGFECKTSDMVTVFGVNGSLTSEGDPARVEPGERVRLTVEMDNALVPGTYLVRAWVVRDLNPDEMGLQFIDILKFDVIGDGTSLGVVSLPAEVVVSREEEKE